MRAAATISEAPYLSIRLCARPLKLHSVFFFLQWVRQQLARDERSEAKARARRRRAARESPSPKDHRRAHRIDPAHYRPPAGQPARPTDPPTDRPTDRPIESSHAPQACTKARTCVQAAVVLSRCSNDYLQVTRERRRGGGTLFWWRLPFVQAVGTSMRVYAMYMPHRPLVWAPAAPLRALYQRATCEIGIPQSLQYPCSATRNVARLVGGSPAPHWSDECLASVKPSVFSTLSTVIGTLSAGMSTLSTVIGTLSGVIRTLSAVISTLSSLISTLSAVVGTLSADSGCRSADERVSRGRRARGDRQRPVHVPAAGRCVEYSRVPRFRSVCWVLTSAV